MKGREGASGADTLTGNFRRIVLPCFELILLHLKTHRQSIGRPPGVRDQEHARCHGARDHRSSGIELDSLIDERTRERLQHARAVEQATADLQTKLKELQLQEQDQLKQCAGGERARYAEHGRAIILWHRNVVGDWARLSPSTSYTTMAQTISEAALEPGGFHLVCRDLRKLDGSAGLICMFVKNRVSGINAAA